MRKSLAFLVIFAAIAFAVSSGRTIGLDDSVRASIHSYATPALTAIMRALTFIGTSGAFAIIGAFFVWWLVRAHRYSAAIWFIALQISANLMLRLLQFSFHRARPNPFFGLAKPESYTFPSGHAMLSTVFFLSLAMLITRKPAARITAAILGFLIGVSRVYLGVHYPTDVLAGFAAGAFWLSAWMFLRSNESRRADA